MCVCMFVCMCVEVFFWFLSWRCSVASYYATQTRSWRRIHRVPSPILISWKEAAAAAVDAAIYAAAVDVAAEVAAVAA